MPTVINNPNATEDSSSNLIMGVILIIVILGAIALFFIYGLPMMQNRQTPNPNNTTIDVNLPEIPNPNPNPNPTPAP